MSIRQLKNQYIKIVIHVGTLVEKLQTYYKLPKASSTSPKRLRTTYCNAILFISELVSRRSMDDEVKTVNKHLNKHCKQNGSNLIRHVHITITGINRGGLQPHNKGNSRLFNNFANNFAMSH